jgi:hypothetical protein
LAKKALKKVGHLALLMLFTDGNRIDLTLLPKNEIKQIIKPIA